MVDQKCVEETQPNYIQDSYQILAENTQVRDTHSEDSKGRGPNQQIEWRNLVMGRHLAINDKCIYGLQLI